MKILPVTIVVLLLTADTYAAEIFSDKAINEIYVSETSIADGVAYVRSTDGITEQVVMGDLLSSKQAEVIEIGPTHITIEAGRTRITMPAINGGSSPEDE